MFNTFFPGKAMREQEANIRKQRRLIRSQLKHMLVNARVVRGNNKILIILKLSP